MQSPIAPVFQTGIVVCILISAAALSLFISPPMVLISLFVGVLGCLIFQRPMVALGILLALMPFNFLAIMLGRFYALPHMTLVAATKEGLLLLIIYVLWRRNGFRVAAPDLFLAGFATLAVINTLFSGGILKALQYDLGFVLPYVTGRVTGLTERQQSLWAKRAVWTATVVSALGMVEVFIIGDGPRTLMYLAVGSDIDVGEGGLTASYRGTGFTGLREASSMIGPLEFGALCMVALIVWWVFSRNPLPGSLVAAGLVCSVSRSAWLGTAAAITVLALVMGEKKRLLLCATLVLALFAAAIPVLGLSDYLSYSATGQDTSAEAHRDSILSGLEYVARHPLGSGPGSIGPQALERNRNVPVFEDTYLAFAAEYGIAATLFFLGFLFSALRLVWRMRSPLGYAAAGILVGISLVMTVLLIHQDFRLACWVWFPIGLAVRSCMNGSTRTVAGRPEMLRRETV